MWVATTWRTSPDEREMAFPCDRLLEQADGAYYRGITIRARPKVIFRWLCQMRVAPYSYDWIDNLGRRSPQVLLPGLEELAIGQQVMGSFELADYERDRHLTIQARKNALGSRIFGDIAGSYLIVPQGSDSCRLLVKLLVRYARGPIGWIMRMLLPWGDLVMMRKQLLNFKKLAEETEGEGHGD